MAVQKGQETSLDQRRKAGGKRRPEHRPNPPLLAAGDLI